jgi:hypothetical protein
MKKMTPNGFQLEIQTFLKAFRNPLGANRALMSRHKVIPSVQELTFTDKTREQVYVYDVAPDVKVTSKVQQEAWGGLILNTDFDIVSCGLPYEPHLNGRLARIHWNDAWMEPDYTGVPLVIYNYKGDTFIQTRSIADLEADDGDSASILFNQVIGALCGADFQEVDSKDKYCWVFKYMDRPFDTKIHKVHEHELILQAAYSKEMNRFVKREYVSRFADICGFVTPACLVVDKQEDALAMPTRSRAEDCPGFVVVDYTGNRASVPVDKRKDVLSKVLTLGPEVTPRNITELVLAGHSEYMIEEHPVYAQCVKLVRGVLYRVLEEVDDNWITLSGKYENRAEFAEEAKKGPYSGILFGLWGGQVLNFKDAMALVKPGDLIVELYNREQRRFSKSFAELIQNLKQEEKYKNGENESKSVSKSQVSG